MGVHEPVAAGPVATTAPEDQAAFLRLSVLAGGGAEAQAAPLSATVSWLVTLAEAAAITLASLISGIAYSWLALGYAGEATAFLGTGVLASVLFSGVMRLREGSGLSPRRGFDAIADASLVWCGVFLFLALVAFLLKVNGEVSRGAILSFFFVGLVSVALARALVPRAIAALYDARQLAGDNVLLVGAADHPAVEALKDTVKATGCASVTVLTVNAGCAEGDWRRELETSLQRILISARVTGHGQICVAGAGFSPMRMAALLAGLQIIPRAIRLVPEPSLERLLHMPLRTIGRARAIELQRAPLNATQRAAKRAIDLAIAIPLLALLAPLFAAIALAIRIESRGAAFFRQERLGRGGRPFAILKFRSMRVLENGANVLQATKNDARVTRVGRFLRKTSLDELPQLVNVILGDMALVGPRPHALAHDKLYATLIDNYELRQHVKPGITGWAQVNGLRGETADVDLMRARVAHDVWYAKNASLFLDLQILVRTFFEVMRARNAY